MKENARYRNGKNKLKQLIRSWSKSEQIKLPIRAKITVPYLFLAILIAISAAFLVTSIVFDTVEERYRNQLGEVGQLSSELMVIEENKLLETKESCSNQEGRE